MLFCLSLLNNGVMFTGGNSHVLKNYFAFKNTHYILLRMDGQRMCIIVKHFITCNSQTVNR